MDASDVRARRAAGRVAAGDPGGLPAHTGPTAEGRAEDPRRRAARPRRGGALPGDRAGLADADQRRTGGVGAEVAVREDRCCCPRKTRDGGVRDGRGARGDPAAVLRRAGLGHGAERGVSLAAECRTRPPVSPSPTPRMASPGAPTSGPCPAPR